MDQYRFKSILLSTGSFLPVVGLITSNWGPTEIATVYVAEMAVLICSYAGVALFAQSPSAVDERDRIELPLLPTPDVSAIPEQIDLPNLPPVRTENINIVSVSVVFYAIITLGLGAAISGNFESRTSENLLDVTDIAAFLSEVLAVIDPGVLTMVGVVSLSQLIVVYQWYINPARHQTLSAYVVAQRLSRLMISYIIFGSLWYGVGSVLILLVELAIPTSSSLILILGFSLIKISVERRRVYGESNPGDTERGRWLVPCE
jgi:hypothetical protein